MDKTLHSASPGGDEPRHDSSNLKVVRFFGGMLLLPGLAYGVAQGALWLGLPYGYGLELPELGYALAMVIAVIGSGFYVALHLQEARITDSSLPATVRYGLGVLSVGMRLLGGYFLSGLVSGPLGTLAGGFVEGAEPIVKIAVGVTCAVLAVVLPMGRKRWF